MGSFNGRAGTQLLAMSSVEKGPEISDTGAPAISEETEGGTSHSCEMSSHPHHMTQDITFCFIGHSQVALALTFRRPQGLSTHPGGLGGRVPSEGPVPFLVE